MANRGPPLAQTDNRHPPDYRGALLPTESPPHHHPSGTLAIVVIYALLFVSGWVAMYLFVFLSRGPVTP
jgi:hypothetical protein